MRVFVAGATGVLGRALVPLLLERGHAVVALARSPEKAASLAALGAEPARGDLLDPALPLARLLAGCRAAVHAATAIPPDPAAPGAWDATARLRTEGTRRLLEAAREAGAERYLQQGIALAYADGGERELDESAPLDASPRRAAVCAPVREMEALVRRAPLQWCLLRAGLFVGAGTSQEALADRVRAGAESVPGDGRAFAPLAHVEDVAQAFALALERAPPGSVYNVAAEPLRVGEYLDRLAAALRAPAPRRDPSRPAPPSLRVSSRAAREALGWRPVRLLLPPWGIALA
jgi:nucleoside-diphosphate-sugar epimerase